MDVACVVCMRVCEQHCNSVENQWLWWGSAAALGFAASSILLLSSSAVAAKPVLQVVNR